MARMIGVMLNQAVQRDVARDAAAKRLPQSPTTVMVSLASMTTSATQAASDASAKISYRAQDSQSRTRPHFVARDAILPKSPHSHGYRSVQTDVDSESKIGT